MSQSSPQTPFDEPQAQARLEAAHDVPTHATVDPSEPVTWISNGVRIRPEDMTTLHIVNALNLLVRRLHNTNGRTKGVRARQRCAHRFIDILADRAMDGITYDDVARNARELKARGLLGNECDLSPTSTPTL